MRKAGAAVQLITDGDVAGVIATTDPATGIDIYIGQGGAPEGVLAAAALRCVGGQIQARLVFRNDDERRRAAKLGIKDFNRKYALMDLASGDVVFSATGVTDGSMLRGVHRDGDYITTESVVMRSATGTVRWIKARHRRARHVAEALAARPPAAFGVARSFSGRRWRLRKRRTRRCARGWRASWRFRRCWRGCWRRAASRQTTSPIISIPTLKRLLPDPSALKDMDKAVARVTSALESGERIAVFGDYDVDGSVSAALLADFLTALGAPPRIYIPDRMTRGLWPVAPRRCWILQAKARRWSSRWIAARPAARRSTAARDVGPRCGGAGSSRGRDARRRRSPMSIPTSRATHPASAYLCAAGVTFLFLVALNRALRDSGWYAAQRHRRAGSARASRSGGAGDGLRCGAADRRQPRLCAPGLGAAVANWRGPGLRRWPRSAKAAPPFTPYHLGFVFGPRINAGGRVGRCSLGVDLLTAHDADAGGRIRRPARPAQSRAPGDREADPGGGHGAGRRPRTMRPSCWWPMTAGIPAWSASSPGG